MSSVLRFIQEFTKKLILIKAFWKLCLILGHCDEDRLFIGGKLEYTVIFLDGVTGAQQ